MTATYAARASRQTLMLAIIAGLHFGAFVLMASGLGMRLIGPMPPPPIVTVIPPKPRPDTVVEPVPQGPFGFNPTPEPEPILRIPVFEDVLPPQAGADKQGQAGVGNGPVVPVEERAPALRTRDGRLAALINACYPPASRRLGEEGRAVARVVIDSQGRAIRWAVDQTSGFPRLDAAMDCVIRRLEFISGRRDGRAVEATALLPIVFALD